MATFGMRDIYIADVTEGSDGTETFGTPAKLAGSKAISAKLDITMADGTLYGDDGIDTQISEFSSAKLTLETTDLADTDVSDLLGRSLDDTSKIVTANKDDDPPYKAIGWRSKKPGGAYHYVWLLKGKFSRSSEEYSTKADKIDFKNPSLVGTFQALNKDGNWMKHISALPSDTAAAAWFNVVPGYSGT